MSFSEFDVTRRTRKGNFHQKYFIAHKKSGLNTLQVKREKTGSSKYLSQA